MKTTVSRRAFTLVELLVVIGIIALLIGILVPVAAGIRKRGYEVRTRAMIAKITAAIHVYNNDWRAFPGIIREDDLQTATNSAPPPSLTVTVTSSENLVLSLLGGLVGAPGNPVSYDASVKSGPQSLNPADPKQYNAYIEVRPGELSKGAVMNDGPIQEFLDGYPDPRPILYMRAHVGAKKIVNYPPGPGSADAQYHIDQLYPYVGDLSASPPTNGYTDFFRNPGLAAAGGGAGGIEVPRGRDAFLLLAAGVDKNWGRPYFSSNPILSGD